MEKAVFCLSILLLGTVAWHLGKASYYGKQLENFLLK